VRAGSSTDGPSSSIVEQQHAAAESDHQVTTSQPTSPVTFDNDWSPLDDGIEVVLPGSDKAPSKKELHAYISTLHHAPSAKRRLPVFEAICQGT